MFQEFGVHFQAYYTKQIVVFESNVRTVRRQFQERFVQRFLALNNMLSLSSANILSTQVTLLHSISAVYEQLVQVLSIMEVTKLSATMLDSLPRELPAQTVQAKLIAIRNLVSSKLFQDDGKWFLNLFLGFVEERKHLLDVVKGFVALMDCKFTWWSVLIIK